MELTLIIGVAGLILGVVGGFFYKNLAAKKSVTSAQKSAEGIVKDAEEKARAIKREADVTAKETELKARVALEKEAKEKQKELGDLEKRLMSREENLEKKFDLLEEKEANVKRQDQSLFDKKKHMDALEKKYQEMVEEARRALENAAGITQDEAKKQLIASLTDDAKLEAAKTIKLIEDEAKENADKKSRYIISTAIERMANEFVADRTVSVVHLPSDEMKGRIIGREGRNIRTLEAALGVELIIDDTPEAVVISGFNPIRREVARRVLEKLIQDGRIHPARIEEMVNKMTKEVDASIKEAGEAAVMEVGVHNVHPELVKLLGALKYRFSYAQNVLRHSMEVSYLAGMMAAELGLNEKKAKRAGLLHDIGKAVSHEQEGSHALIGMEFAKKYREDPDIVHAIGAHHEDLSQDTALDCIVDAADALSGARPGARREVMETYMKRLDDLERISTSFRGVEKSYAIQAGREIRVMVDAGEINDANSLVLAKDIAKKIETEMTYPGQIKVTVIRETRAIEIAK
ncbi:MAG: ribonuclease Y [Deltaproteobacteria bacterium CG11_big_fil_rev_8_21_14_0_20_49_13]|nr:MAG: ribonuclease Y [Deltaproteobacteria bacterium CG11_big_fil_rev_8_21_14_0_20_49_13]